MNPKDKNKSKEENKSQGNVYDRIIKENAQSIFIPLLERELGLKIKSYKALQEKITKTIERETDFLYRVILEENEYEKEVLLHIEFQVKDAKAMLSRMVEYHGLIYRKYQMPIFHVVVFLGAKKAKMRSKLRSDEIFEGFELINVYELNTEELLSSQIPEIILLAILSNHQEERLEGILRLIVNRLKKVASSESELHRYINQLTILAKLRKLEKQTIKILNQMSITYNIEEDYCYQEGLKKGQKKGLEQGRTEERQLIESEKEAGVIKLLKMGIEEKEIADIMSVPLEFVKKVKKKHPDKI